MTKREQVEKQFGWRSVKALDTYADLLFQQWCDAQIGRTDRNEDLEVRSLRLRETIAEFGGPVCRMLIQPVSGADTRKLHDMVDSYHEVDMALEPHFQLDYSVLLDSEASCMFVHATPDATPKVLLVLAEKFPAVRFSAVKQQIELSPVGCMPNWPAAKEWLKEKYELQRKIEAAHELPA